MEGVWQKLKVWILLMTVRLYKLGWLYLICPSCENSLYVQIMMSDFHVDAGNIFMDWGLIMSFSTVIKEWVSTKVHIGYCSQFYYDKNLLHESSNTCCFMENSRELMKIDGGLHWATIPTNIPYHGLSNLQVGKSTDWVQ